MLLRCADSPGSNRRKPKGLLPRRTGRNPKECTADEYQLILPVPREAEQVILSATGSLVLGAGSIVKARNGADGEVANLGRVTTILGSNASVGSLLSDAEVTLGAGAVVNGPLTTGGKLVVPSSAVLKGKVTTNAPIHGVQSALATVKFSAGAAVDVPGGSTRKLAPGTYGEVQVDSGGTLSLSSGTYFASSVTVLSGATLELDETAGAIVVYVKNRVTFAGVERQVGSDGHVLIAAFGCEPDLLWAPFHGTVSAQNAWLSLIAPTKSAKETFAGRFFANSIEVGAGTTVVGLGVTLPSGPPQAAGSPPPRLPASLPTPPPEEGCYVNTSKWLETSGVCNARFYQQPFSAS